MDWRSYIAIAILVWCALCIVCSGYILFIARKELASLRRKKVASDFSAAPEGYIRHVRGLNREAAE